MSMAHAYAMKKRMAKGGHVKGVHKQESMMPSHSEGEEKGRSNAGGYLELSRETGSKNGVAAAKREHQKVLGEMHSMRGQDRKYLAEGGDVACAAHGLDMCKECHGGMYEDGGEVTEEDPLKIAGKSIRTAFGTKYAEGGFVKDEEASGYEDMPMEDEMGHDVVRRILESRKMSKGGRVANDSSPMVDFEDNEFDDLVKDDDLEMHETGANSGDELGNMQEDDDRRDIVKRIMKSRHKKDRMPHPA